VLVVHLWFGEVALHHRPIEVTEVNEVRVPHQDRENRKDRLPAVRRLRCGDELTREDLRRGNRVPHHESRHRHEDRPPDDRPVLQLLSEGELRFARRLRPESEVEHDGVCSSAAVIETRQHLTADPLHIEAVPGGTQVIGRGDQNDHAKRPMYVARVVDAAERGDDRPGES